MRIRKIVSGTAEHPRMTVFRSNKQIYVQFIDDLAGVTLVERVVGGAGGGGARLTPAAEQLLAAADAVRQARVSALAQLEGGGADLAVARLRRRESLKTWAKRMGVSVPTLQRLAAGDPAVGIGIVATALWLIQRDGELGNLAAPEHDQGAIELEVREAVELGRARAQASAEARLRAKKS